MIEEYTKHSEERSKTNLPPLPLTAEQTADLINVIKLEKDESSGRC